MNDNHFTNLLESIRTAGAVRRGEIAGARVTIIAEPDARAIRERYGMSQETFAAMLGISRRTLEGWEQGRRRPTGPARRLLQVAERFPQELYDTVFARQSTITGATTKGRAKNGTTTKAKRTTGVATNGSINKRSTTNGSEKKSTRRAAASTARSGRSTTKAKVTIKSNPSPRGRGKSGTSRP